jgi:hypothetical protein
MLLLTRCVTFFFVDSVAWPLRSADGAGVSGALKGCAADVDVAAGGMCEDVESPCCGAVCVDVEAEMGVASRRVEVEVRKRRGCARDADERAREAARRQLRQIILVDVEISIELVAMVSKV